jgi:hypothetical protein
VVNGTTSKYGSSARTGFALTADATTLDAADLLGIPPPSVGLVDITVRTADGRPVRNPTVEVHLEGPNGTFANGYPLYGRQVVNGAAVRWPSSRSGSARAASPASWSSGSGSVGRERCAR